MLIFIDTEFTDFKNPDLISIGLVTEDGAHEFYAELPVDLAKCNDFVVTTVLPQLGKTPGALCSAVDLDQRLRQWLGQFEHYAPVTICCDFAGDWHLLCRAMKFEIPGWIKARNIYPYLDPVALRMYFIDNRLSDHHALHDARANRHAFDAEKTRTDVMQFRRSR
jgi:3' exoribonuclease, RNase T-like